MYHSLALFLSVVFAVSISLAQQTAPAGTARAADPGKQTSPPTAEQQERLEELGKEIEQAVTAGRLDQAISLLKEICQVEESVYGENHEELLGSLDYLAQLSTAKQDYSGATSYRQRAATMAKRVYGPDDYRAGDALRASNEAQQDARRTPEQRARLSQANQQQQRVIQFFRDGQFGNAIKIAKQAHQIREQVLGKQHPLYADSLNTLALLHHMRGDYVGAEPLYQEAEQILQQVLGKQHPRYATTLNSLASLYEDQGDLARAEPLLLEAKSIRERVLGTQHPQYASSLNGLAHLYGNRGEYGRAESLLQEAVQIRARVLGKQHPQYADSLNNLAMVYYHQGDLTRAEPLYLEAKQICEQVLGGHHPQYATTINNLAGLYQSQGDYARAEPLYLEAKQIRERVVGKQHPQYGQSLNNLAELYRAQGSYARAEPLYLEAKQICERVVGKRHPQYAVSLNNLALLYDARGDDARAEPLYVEAKEIQEQVLGKQHPSYANTVSNLAALYLDQRDYSRAKSLLLQAKQIREQAFGTRNVEYANSLNNLAMLYRAEGDYARGESLCLEAQAICEQVLGKQHPHYATSLNSLAEQYHDQGDYGRAESLHREAKQIRENVLGKQHLHYATSLNNLAALYDIQGDYARADPLFVEAHNIRQSVTEQVVPTLSRAQASSWMRTNTPATGTVLSVLQRTGSADVDAAYRFVWQTRGATSRLQLGQKVRADAPEEAWRVAQELRQARLKLASLITATPTAEQAAHYQAQFATFNERKERLEKKLAEVNPATGRAIQVRDATVKDLLEILPPRVAVVDLSLQRELGHQKSQVVHKLEDGTSETVIVNKVEWQNVYHAFVLRTHQRAGQHPIVWIPLGEAEPIDAAVRQLRSTLADRFAPQTGEDPGTTLRERIWKPIEPHLAGCDIVILVPDASLHYLPWAALPGRKQGSYLIEDYALATTLSGQELFRLLTEPPVVGDQLLIAGGIHYDKRNGSSERRDDTPSPLQMAGKRGPADVRKGQGSWSFLEGAAAEAEAIARIWSQQRPNVRLSGRRATEHLLARALPQSRFTHLATHGFFETRGEVYPTDLRAQPLFQTNLAGDRPDATAAGRNPLLMTGIVLAGANLGPVKDEHGLPTGDDGIMTAEEIMGLNLGNTDLVTLSACETALGDVAAGQGIMGLQRALHDAGARTTVASLWKVDDRATQALMQMFYTNLWDKRQPKLQALRNAQLHLLNHPVLPDGNRLTRGEQEALPEDPNLPLRVADRTHPFFWAAWTLSGDWR